MAYKPLCSIAEVKSALFLDMISDMPHGTDRPYPIRMLAFFEMIRPYHVVIRISGNSRGKL